MPLILLLSLVVLGALGAGAFAALSALSGADRSTAGGNSVANADRNTDSSADSAAGSAQLGPVTNLMKHASIAVPSVAPPGLDSMNNSVTYVAEKMADQDPNTAWRMLGSGTGQKITLTFDQPVVIKEVGIINGYAKKDPHSGEQRYTQGRRILDGTWGIGSEQFSTEYSPQNQSMQSFTLKKPIQTTSITLTIGAVTAPGSTATQHDYTAISEIRVKGSTR